MKDRVIVGAIGGAFGVHGEVRLKSYCADPAAIADYTPLYTENGRAFAQVVLTGQMKNGFTARIDGITTKEEADSLRNTALLRDEIGLQGRHGFARGFFCASRCFDRIPERRQLLL